MVFFVCKALMGPLLYIRRVGCSAADVVGSALAGMALSHGIAQGVFAGLWHKTAVFEITEKGAGDAGQQAARKSAASAFASSPAEMGASGGSDATSPDGSASGQAPESGQLVAPRKARPSGPPWAGVREEGLMLIALLACVGAMAWTRLPNHVESAMWMSILVLQAVPYLAAVVCAGLSALPEYRRRPRARAALAHPAQATQAPQVLAPVGLGSGAPSGL